MEGNISTVLIVDNDGSFRKVVRALFEQGGFDLCIEAGSSTEAIQRARHFQPNLVILEFSLPGMNGLQLAQELREIMPRLPIFMLTADRNLHLEKEALSCGINAVFSKLDGLETLLANARAACGIK
jgi:CheY-like chemotaxis protein